MAPPRHIAVVPIYNESKHLGQVLATFSARMDVTIAVNDGSTDGCSQILATWIAGQPGSYVVDNTVNRGKASALKDGFALATLLMDAGVLSPDDLLYTFDADGQHTVDAIGQLGERMVSGDLDMLLTRRDFRHYPRFKKVGNWGLSMFASILGGFRYDDVECGFRVLKLGRVPEILSYYTGYKYSSEQELGIIAARLRYRIDNTFDVEVPHYRAGTKVPDGIINISLGFVSFLRVVLGLAGSRHAFVRRMRSRRILAGPGCSLPAALAVGAHHPAAPRPPARAAAPVKLDH